MAAIVGEKEAIRTARKNLQAKIKLLDEGARTCKRFSGYQILGKHINQAKEMRRKTLSETLLAGINGDAKNDTAGSPPAKLGGNKGAKTNGVATNGETSPNSTSPIRSRTGRRR